MVSVLGKAGWGDQLAERIDKAIEMLSAGHDVITVCVTGAYTEYTSETPYQATVWLKGGATTSVIVTVVWCDDEQSE